jgi:hypothetical protein
VSHTLRRTNPAYSSGIDLVVGDPSVSDEVLRHVVVMRALAAGQFDGLADVRERCIFIKSAGTKRFKSSREGSQHSSRKASIISYSFSN